MPLPSLLPPQLLLHQASSRRQVAARSSCVLQVRQALPRRRRHLQQQQQRRQTTCSVWVMHLEAWAWAVALQQRSSRRRQQPLLQGRLQHRPLRMIGCRFKCMAFTFVPAREAVD